MNILILGGYGVFDGRLAQLLAHKEELTLLIAGRSEKKAKDFCKTIVGAATAKPLFFDRNADVNIQLKQIQPDLLIDATGPFQVYGDNPYRVVEACIACNINYMDFADASDFVKGIDQYDKDAKAADIYVLSGVSSFPILTAAVVRRLSKDLTQVNSIIGGIAPSPFAGVGPNVIRAITSYAGKPVKLMRDGKASHGYGLIENKRYTICPPGYLPLSNIRFSLVDVPDLQVLPELWPGVNHVWMGAGTVPESLHRMLNGFAFLVRWKILPSLLPFASLFHFVINILRWGEHRGGMFVEVDGVKANGEKVSRSWHLLAEGDDGPFIPAMALEALIYRELANNKPPSGARSAATDLELEDYEELFKNRKIYMGTRASDQEKSLLTNYQKILDDAWFQLPQQIKAMHDWRESLTAEGFAQIDRGTTIFSKLIAGLFGFPKAGKDIPIKVCFSRNKKGEVWQRVFNGKAFKSIQAEGKGKFDKLIEESFGPFTFGLALVLDDKKLHVIVRRWTFLGLPLPLALSPNGESYECVENGKYSFHVEINLPLVGFMVRYRGFLSIVHKS